MTEDHCQDDDGNSPRMRADLLLAVVTDMTLNARRVAIAAAAEAVGLGDPDVAGAVVSALAGETRGILAGSNPERPEIGIAVRAAGQAMAALAEQALLNQPNQPEQALAAAFDVFTLYLEGPGKDRILGGIVSDQIG